MQQQPGPVEQGRPPRGTPLERAQLAFFGLVVFNLVGALMSSLSAGWPTTATSFAVTTLGLLTLWLTAAWRRGRFPRGGWVVESLLLTGYVGISGGEGLALGLAFPVLMFTALYGPPLAAWARPAAYATVYGSAAVLLSDTSTTEAASLFAVMVVGMMFTSQVIHYLRGTLLAAQRNAEVAAQNLEQLRQLEQMKNAFLSATSHELRTPVTVIQGLAEIVATRSRDLTTDQLQTLLQRLDANSRRLSGLLDDLLDVDRLTRTEISADRSPVDIAALAAETVTLLEPSGRRITLPRDPVVANADHVMVERIVENLVRNAFKYTPPGTSVHVTVDRAGEDVVITVEDHGDGIPVEAREAIFQPFHRLDDAHPSPGTGIGLSLVARFAEAHGGTAWVETGRHGGARFCVRLPDDVPGTATDTVDDAADDRAVSSEARRARSRGGSRHHGRAREADRVDA